MTLETTAEEERSTPPKADAARDRAPARFAPVWRPYALAWLAVLAVILVLFRAEAISMVEKWENDETFGHAWLILPIVLWLVWMRRGLLARVNPRPFWWGLVPMAGAALLWVVGDVARVAFVEQFALVFMIQASVLTVLGLAVTRTLLFPLFYLLFLVPFGDQIVPMLQDFTARFSVSLLEWLNVPTYHDGIFISIPTGDFEVAQACSGVRFVIAMLAVGSLYANVAFASPWRRAAIIGLSLVVPVIANGFRAFGIIYIAHLTDSEYAVGVDHIVYGWVFFSIVMIAVLLIGRLFSDRWIDDPAMDVEAKGLTRAGAGTARQAWLAVSAVAGIALLGAAYGSWMDHRAASISFAELTPPEVAGWQSAALPADWKPHFAGADAELFHAYTDGTRTVSLYVAAFSRQTDEHELVAYGQTAVAPSDTWTWAASLPGRLTVGGKATEAQAMQINARGKVRDVWQWYWVNGKLTGNPYVAKIEGLKAKLFGGDLVAATLVLSAERVDVTVRSTEDLQAFADDLGPIEASLRAILSAGAKGQ